MKKLTLISTLLLASSLSFKIKAQIVNNYTINAAQYGMIVGVPEMHPTNMARMNAFDTKMRSIPENSNIFFEAGVFLTKGAWPTEWKVLPTQGEVTAYPQTGNDPGHLGFELKNGWKITGNGSGIVGGNPTILKLNYCAIVEFEFPIINTSSAKPWEGRNIILATNTLTPHSNITIKNIQLDCNYLGLQNYWRSPLINHMHNTYDNTVFTLSAISLQGTNNLAIEDVKVVHAVSNAYLGSKKVVNGTSYVTTELRESFPVFMGRSNSDGSRNDNFKIKNCLVTDFPAPSPSSSYNSVGYPNSQLGYGYLSVILMTGMNGGSIETNTVNFGPYQSPANIGFAYNFSSSRNLSINANTSNYAQNGINMDYAGVPPNANFETYNMNVANNYFNNCYWHGIRLGCTVETGTITNNNISMIGTANKAAITEENWNSDNRMTITNNNISAENNSGFGISLISPQHTVTGNLIRLVSSTSNTNQLRNSICPGVYALGNVFSGAVGQAGCNTAKGFNQYCTRPTAASNSVWLESVVLDHSVSYYNYKFAPYISSGNNTNDFAHRDGKPLTQFNGYTDYTNQSDANAYNDVTSYGARNWEGTIPMYLNQNGTIWHQGNIAKISANENRWLGITPGGVGQAPVFIRVWIDYNHDENFDSNTELVIDADGVTGSTSYLYFQIPSTAIYGSARMRIIVKSATATTPPAAYEQGFQGEIEDHAVFIYGVANQWGHAFGLRTTETKNDSLATNVIAKDKTPSANIFPNPTNGAFSIDFDNSDLNENVSILVYDILGKVISKAHLLQNQRIVDFDLSNEMEGAYMIKIFNGKEIINKKVLVTKN